jgi:Phosphotransferase enzyme family
MRIEGGYTPAERWVVRDQSTSSAFFVKKGSTPHTALLLRREIRAYECVHGDFLPTVIGWEDHETSPILIIEDLSTAIWPPPWNASLIDGVLQSIANMHASRAALPPYREIHGARSLGWAEVAIDPLPFLSLDIVSADWLERSLPVLLQAGAGCDPSGEAVTHWDIRSDNLCLAADGVKLIDWAEACLSNPKLDLGFWLPSLAFEGGPLPEVLLPHEPEIAAWVSGFFAARAGLPEVPDAPFVRRVQRQQLSTALPWVRRSLQLDQFPAA